MAHRVSLGLSAAVCRLNVERRHEEESYLLKLNYMGMQEHAVIHNLSLHISTCHLLSSLNELDGNLHTKDTQDEYRSLAATDTPREGIPVEHA